jgi:hypothetical protein
VEALERAQALLEGTADTQAATWVRANLSRLLVRAGRYTEAHTLSAPLVAAADVHASAAGPASVVWIAGVLWTDATALWLGSDAAAAYTRYEQGRVHAHVGTGRAQRTDAVTLICMGQRCGRPRQQGRRPERLLCGRGWCWRCAASSWHRTRAMAPHAHWHAPSSSAQRLIKARRGCRRFPPCCCWRVCMWLLALRPPWPPLHSCVCDR